MTRKLMIALFAVGAAMGVTATDKATDIESSRSQEKAEYKRLQVEGKKKEAAVQLRKIRKQRIASELDAYAAKYPTEVANLKKLLAEDSDAFRQAYREFKRQLRRDNRKSLEQ